MGSFSPPQDEVKSSDSVPTSEEYEILKDHSPIPETGGTGGAWRGGSGVFTLHCVAK